MSQSTYISMMQRASTASRIIIMIIITTRNLTQPQERAYDKYTKL